MTVAVGGLFAAIANWQKSTAAAAGFRSITAAEQAAGKDRWIDARAILEDQARRHGRPADPIIAQRWRRLEFRVAGALKDFASIEALVRLDPSLYESDETAALWLWRLRRVAGDDAGAEMVRAHWREAGHDKVGWLCAEVDSLVSNRQRGEAMKLLAKFQPQSPADVPLLLRRGMLTADPKELTAVFNQAYQLDPKNADLRSLRAAALESVGQFGYARVDYVAAVLADPKNPLRRDELASFYLRQGNLLDAVATWREGLGPTSPDFMWERALFWGRVLGVVAPAPGLLGDSRKIGFVGFLANLPAGRFWDEAGYEKLYLPITHAQREPAVTWLRVLEFLRVGDRTNATATLNQAPLAAVQAAPALHAALRVTLAVRSGTKPEKTGIVWPNTRGSGHRWRDILGAAAQGEAAAVAELSAMAAGPHAEVAALIAAGWTGPACQLVNWDRALKADTPVWLQYSLLQARRMVEGPTPALKWANGLPAAPVIELLRSEIQMTVGMASAAQPTLARLATRSDDTGYAASWRLATWHMEQGHAAEAQRIVMNSPPLHATVLGTEMLARCALVQGQQETARKLYESILDSSLESGAFIARHSFAARDWKRAREITEYWLNRLPDNLQLRANLEAISAAERTGATP